MKAHPYARLVATILQRQGFLDVRLEDAVAKRLWRSRGRGYIPFDISYLIFQPLPARHYAECKYRRGQAVGEKGVAKFLADLSLCGIPVSRGAIITNNGYTPLARDYAADAGLALYTLEPRRAWKRLSWREQFLERPRRAWERLTTGTVLLERPFRRLQ